VHEDVGICTGQDRRAVYLAGMGNRFTQAPNADNVIANQTQLGIEERGYEMLLLRFMAGVFGNNLPPQTIGRLRRVHRTPGGSVLVECGFAHEGIRVVGVKYDFLEAQHSKERAKPAKAPEKAAHKPRFHKEKAKRQEPPNEKVIHFTKPELREEPDEESEAIQDLRNQVRHAMELLEQGRQVAAFNLLKRIVDS